MGSMLIQRRRHQQRLPGLFVQGDRRSVDRASRSCRMEMGSRNAPTLDGLIAGAWEELGAREIGHCPACGGAMAPCVNSLGEMLHGDCQDCGARLS
jgi:hypothetical protein